jgi:hypothetical protein
MEALPIIFLPLPMKLIRKGHTVQIYATGAALKKFQGRMMPGVIPFTLENISEEEAARDIVKKCCRAAVVITDVGNPFAISLQKTLASQSPSVLRLAYYDNPESYVPGGYSTES